MKRTLFPPISFFLLVLLITSSGCEIIEDVACKKGDGARMTEIRDLDGFSEILIDMPGDVYISQGDSFAVSITAQENILAEISTGVSGELLEVTNTSCLGNHKTIRVEITLPTLLGLEVKNSGDVYGETPFDTDALRLTVDGSGGIELTAKVGKGTVEMKGSGNIFANLEAGILNTVSDGSGEITLQGTSDANNIEIKRSGMVRAFDLMTLESTVVTDGRGDCEISVQDSLSVTIKASGNVLYKGNPTISVDISGSGDLKDAN